MSDRKLLFLLVAITGVSLFINVKFAIAATKAQGTVEDFKANPIGAIKHLFGG